MDLKIHHISFTVNNLEESINWYKEKLGFKLLSRHKNNTMEFVLLELDGIKIELFNFGNQTKRLPNYRKELMSDLKTAGIKHLCFKTSNLKKTISKLKTAGVELVTKTDVASYGGRYIFFKDCNGILIELIET